MHQELYSPSYARARMIEQQIRTADVHDRRVLSVLTTVSREEFVPEALRKLAYADTNIPLLHGHAMMTPQIEGELLQALALTDQDDVLEIGTGSGYLTACLAQLAGHVTSIELHADQLEKARAALDRTGIRNIDTSCEDVFHRRDDRQFDAIAVTGSLPLHDERFERWLRPGGRLFLIIGQGPAMEAKLISRSSSGLQTTSLFETAIEPVENAPQPESFTF